MNESTIEAQLIRGVHRQGGRCEKWGRHGWPDRIIIWPGGRIDFVETKAPGERLRALQQKRAETLRALGARVYCLDSAQAVDEYVEGVSHAL